MKGTGLWTRALGAVAVLAIASSCADAPMQAADAGESAKHHGGSCPWGWPWCPPPPPKHHCGDGCVDPGEQCDDGNTVAGDGCSPTCHNEVCGNGYLDPGEQCDDGNTVAGDGCSPTCHEEVCGNGYLDPGEQCDDGNTTAGDGCSATCVKEVCGNGILDPGEACDDGNTVSGDGCSSECQLEIIGCDTGINGDCCGNGVIDPGEECDDGNTDNGDGCSSTCQVEHPICPAPFGVTASYNVFAFNDILGSPDIEGAAAAADLVQLTGFSVGQMSPISTGLVGGRLILNNGQIYHNAFYGTSQSLASVNIVGGSLFHASPINFLAAKLQAENASGFYAALPANGTTAVVNYSGNKQITLNGTSLTVNIFTIAAADLAAARQVTVNVPAGSTVLVNVPGAAISAGNMGFFLHGVSASRILWNLPNATSFTLSSVEWPGSMLAPFATVNFSNGNFDGTLVADSAIGNGEYHQVAFLGDPCPPRPPCPPWQQP